MIKEWFDFLYKDKTRDEIMEQFYYENTQLNIAEEKIHKAIEYLEEAEKGLEEYHFDGYDPNLPYVISILKGDEDNE